jgi:hypothetical protein
VPGPVFSFGSSKHRMCDMNVYVAGRRDY